MIWAFLAGFLAALALVWLGVRREAIDWHLGPVRFRSIGKVGLIEFGGVSIARIGRRWARLRRGL